MSLVHVDPSELWRDSSASTAAETCMMQLGDGLAKFLSKTARKHIFKLDGFTFKIALHPALPEGAINPGSHSAIVRRLFRPSTDFVVLKIDPRVDGHPLRAVMLSIISPTVQEFRYPLPVFWNIPLKPYYTYQGVLFVGHQYLHFASLTVWKDPPEIASLGEIARSFGAMFPLVADRTFSAGWSFDCARRFSDIQKSSRLNFSWLELRKSCFRSLQLNFEWPPRPIGTEISLSLNGASTVTFRIVTESAPWFKTRIAWLLKKASSHRTVTFKDYLRDHPIRAESRATLHKLVVSEQKPITRSDLLWKSAPPDSFLASFADLVSGRKCDFAELWTLLLEHLERSLRTRTRLPNILSEPIEFRACLLFQKLQAVNFCVDVIGRSRKGFIQTEDEFKTARAHFEATKKDEYLLSCYRTFAEHGMGTLEEFEAAYGQKLIDPTAIPEFNAESEWEIAMDDLRAVLPSELIESLVLILLESAFASLREMTLLEAPGVGEAIQAIEAAAREWTPDTAELPAHIDLVLSHFGALMIPIALLALIPDRELVCELLRNNSLTISVADHLELVRNVVSALQIDMSRSAPLFHSSEIEFAGVIGESGQKLLAACEPDGDRMKSTVAWTISELI